MLPTRPRCVLHTSAAKRTTRQSSAECEVLCMQRCLKLGMGVMIRLYAARVNRLARCVDISWPVSTRHVSYHEYLWTHGFCHLPVRGSSQSQRSAQTHREPQDTLHL